MKAAKATIKKKTPKSAAVTKGHDWKTLFINALIKTGNISVAAEMAQINRKTPYKAYDIDPDFARRWDEAIETYADNSEYEIDRRAFVGYDEPVFYQGKECGKVRKFSDTLAIFRLKALRPEKYRERYSVGIDLAYELKRKQDELGITDEQIASNETLAPIFARAGLIRISNAGNGNAGEGVSDSD